MEPNFDRCRPEKSRKKRIGKPQTLKRDAQTEKGEKTMKTSKSLARSQLDAQTGCVAGCALPFILCLRFASDVWQSQLDSQQSSQLKLWLHSWLFGCPLLGKRGRSGRIILNCLPSGWRRNNCLNPRPHTSLQCQLAAQLAAQLVALLTAQHRAFARTPEENDFY